MIYFMHVCTSKKFKAKSLKRQESKKQKVRSDRHSFINSEIFFHNEGKSQIGHWAYLIHAFLVFSVTCETLTDDLA